MLSDKLICVDMDGVVFNWELSFDLWMLKHGYRKTKEGSYSLAECYGLCKEEANTLANMFNETIYIRNLPPMRDAISGIKYLHEECGYVFHGITSISNDYQIAKSREHNTKDLFGNTAFIKIDCLDHSTSKSTILSQYQGSGCWWVEDLPSNIQIGEALGLRGILVDQHYNKSYYFPRRAYTWKEIITIIKENK